MRVLIKYNVCLLLFGMIILSSCDKSDHSFIPQSNYTPTSNVIDTLKGKEFQFDSLKWEYDDNVDNVFITINNRPDLFKYTRDMDVSLMADSSTGWVPVRKSSSELPYYGFLYGLYHGPLYGTYNYVFVIVPRPANVLLEGKVASVKVRF